MPDNRLLSELCEELREYVAPLLNTTLFARLACGKVDECPFRGLEELRERVYRKFEREGEEDRSPLEARLLDAFLKQTDDPERELSSFAQGVRVGVEINMPTVPAIYSRKRRWKLREQEDPEAYKSYEQWEEQTTKTTPLLQSWRRQSRTNLSRR